MRPLQPKVNYNYIMDNQNLKKTALNKRHIDLGARMVPFAGWEMPLQYGKITEEHNTVRSSAGLFDVSHMGEFLLSGKGALNLLERLVPQNVSKLKEGKALYCQICNPAGGIIDDLIIYRLPDINQTYRFLLVVNASNLEKDYNWILANQDDTTDIKFENISNHYSLLALQGPNASLILSFLGLKEEKQPKFFNCIETKLSGIDCILARTGYTGEDGFEIFIRNDNAGTLWDLILDKGQEQGIKPIGLAARDTLRLEAALALHGNDINEDITPVEAGFGKTIAKTKDSFIGKDVILKQLDHGVDKVFVGFKMLKSNIPRQGCELFKENKIIGNTTSGSIAPYLNIPIGLGYVEKKAGIKPGDEIEVLIRNKKCPAVIVELPFYKRERK
jgi:aminomethyltransferase